MTAFGLGVLRLCPKDFWASTPREIAAAARGLLGPAPAPLTQRELEALMTRYPDEATRDGD